MMRLSHGGLIQALEAIRIKGSKVSLAQRGSEKQVQRRMAQFKGDLIIHSIQARDSFPFTVHFDLQGCLMRGQSQFVLLGRIIERNMNLEACLKLISTKFRYRSHL